MVNIFLYFIIFNSLHIARTSNILAVLPTLTITPQHMFTSLLSDISNRGHEITFVTTNKEISKIRSLENITIINMSNKLNAIWQKYNNILVSDQNRDVLSEVSLTLHGTNYFCEELLQTDEMKDLIDEKHSYFDLLLLEASMIPLISLSHIFKSPVILVSSGDAVWDNYEIVGAPTHPLLYPSIFRRRVYNLTTMEKVVEMSSQFRVKLKLLSNENKVNIILKERFGSDFPSLSELKKNVFALFVNSNSIWSGNRPVSSNVIFMGGMQTNYLEELSEDLQSVLDKSVNGVIYVSFGSIIKPSQISPEKLLRILNTLSELPYDIVLKWDNDRLPGAPKNIKIYTWLPQYSLLAHPKVKLFITHGGIQSTFESINAGVPLIGIPMYFDQWYNTEKYVHFHIGLQMDLATLTENNLADAIRLVIKNEGYRNSIAELRTLMDDQPRLSINRAIWWIENVLRPYGAQHLRSPAANLSWTEYLELDFIFFILLSISVLTVLFVALITLLILFVRDSFDDIKKKIS